MEKELTRREKNILGYIMVFFIEASLLVLSVLAYNFDGQLSSGMFLGMFSAIAIIDYQDFRNSKMKNENKK